MKDCYIINKEIKKRFLNLEKTVKVDLKFGVYRLDVGAYETFHPGIDRTIRES